MNYIYKKYIWVFIISIGLLIVMAYCFPSSVKEGFTVAKGFEPWPKDLIVRFNIFRIYLECSYFTSVS